jgi:hypothetical protein
LWLLAPDGALDIGGVWLLRGGEHDHGHGHSLSHGERLDHDDADRIATRGGVVILEVFEEESRRFRLRAETGPLLAEASSTIVASPVFAAATSPGKPTAASLPRSPSNSITAAIAGSGCPRS